MIAGIWFTKLTDGVIKDRLNDCAVHGPRLQNPTNAVGGIIEGRHIRLKDNKKDPQTSLMGFAPKRKAAHLITPSDMRSGNVLWTINS